MPVRVEFVTHATNDLAGYARTGNLPLFLKKLLRLEEVGMDAGLPLGRGLTGYRKIVVGDRNWRIIFTMNSDETVATILVIGDRDDAECSAEAERRVRAIGTSSLPASSLAAVMFQLSQAQRTTKRRR